jgi:hypothetical protein
MKKWFASFGDASNEHIKSVYDITPDVAEALIAAARRDISVRKPRYATDFEGLIETIAQASRVIAAMEELREAAIVAADRTSDDADRKRIGIAAAMPPTRIYRVLEKHGRPRRRAKSKPEIAVGSRIVIPAHAVPDDWPTTGEVTEIGEETTVVELDNGKLQELPSDEVTLA